MEDCCFIAYRMKSKLTLVMAKFCAVILLITVVALPAQTYAQSISAGFGFSGIVAGPVLLPFAFPACPYHILIVKLGPFPVYQPQFLGIIPLPGSLIYEHFNIITPGNWVLGTYAIPTFLPPACPYPVAPLIQTGTSLLPGI